MWATWWVVGALGSQHGSGRKPEPRLSDPTLQTIHCAYRASITYQTTGESMPGRTAKTDLPSFPANFVLWDMKKVSKMKWWHDMADVLPQLDAGTRQLFARGTSTVDRRQVQNRMDISKARPRGQHQQKRCV